MTNLATATDNPSTPVPGTPQVVSSNNESGRPTPSGFVSPQDFRGYPKVRRVWKMNSLALHFITISDKSRRSSRELDVTCISFMS